MRRLEALDLGLVAVAAAVWCGLLAFLPSEMSPDGWYAFLGGDVIVHHGLPSHDTLTVWGHGHRWVDQQWLAQLAYYGLYALGGLRLALIVNAAIILGAFMLALRGGRVRGGAARDVFYVGAIVALAVGLNAAALRPETLALPLFVSLAWLLVGDAREPSRRVFWVVPLLILWANLHGTATLGVLLVLLAAGADFWSRRFLALRSATLTLLSIAALFASPYAPHLTGYYRTILFNRDFAKYLPDWMPTALGPKTAAFYVLAFAVVLMMARAPRVLTLFEKLALVVLLVLAIEASRGIVWFSLFALMTLPRLLRGTKLPATRVSAVTRTSIVAASGTAVAVALVLAGARPNSWFASNYPDSAARTAAVAAGADRKVFANGAYADWLLLVQPSLRGRIAYDARFELLPHGRLSDAAAISIGRWDALHILRPFDTLVLRPQERELRETLTRGGNWDRIPTSPAVVVLRRVR